MKGKGMVQKGFWDHERIKGIYAHTDVKYMYCEKELDSHYSNIILYLVGIFESPNVLGIVLITHL